MKCLCPCLLLPQPPPTESLSQLSPTGVSTGGGRRLNSVHRAVAAKQKKANEKSRKGGCSMNGCRRQKRTSRGGDETVTACSSKLREHKHDTRVGNVRGLAAAAVEYSHRSAAASPAHALYRDGEQEKYDVMSADSLLCVWC